MADVRLWWQRILRQDNKPNQCRRYDGPILGVLTTTNHRGNSELLSECFVDSNERTASGIRVYVDAADAGFINRFMNQSCSAKARFVERRYQRHIVAVVVAEEGIKPGEEVPVSYGDALLL